MRSCRTVTIRSSPHRASWRRTEATAAKPLAREAEITAVARTAAARKARIKSVASISVNLVWQAPYWTTAAGNSW
jgi:hypothetical protein